MGQARTVSLAIAAMLVATAASAQDAKSASGARELAGLLVQKKLDAVAARDPAAPDAFVAALHFPGQLLIIFGALHRAAAAQREAGPPRVP